MPWRASAEAILALPNAQSQHCRSPTGVVTNNANLRVVQVVVATFAQGDAIEWDKIFAALSIAAAVPVALFIIFQRYYVRGIATTGLRG